MNQSSLLFRTEQIVVTELSDKPYVGFELSAAPDGWQYDVKRWASPFDLKLPTLPRLADASTQGVSETEYFKSGVGDKDLGDLYLKEVSEIFVNGYSYWVPNLQNGTYFKNKTSFFYYSDDSLIQYLNKSDNRDNRNYIELDKTPSFSSPILAASFRRNFDDMSIDYQDRFFQRQRFTGLYSNGEELTTVTDFGKIYWDNVDTYKKEFIVDNSIDDIFRLFFNRDYIKTVGVEVSSVSDLFACEHLGKSTGSGHYILSDGTTEIYVQSYYLKYFPVFTGNDFHLYVSDDTTYTEWTPVNSWWDLISEVRNTSYFVDKDLGIVYFASQNPTKLPIQGINIYAQYSVNLRIEYEPFDSNFNITASQSNLNPISQGTNQGFVCISHQNLDPASITLTIDKPIIDITAATKEHGPIEIGSDYAVLTANVKSVSGINLPNIPVTFEMNPVGLGFLNGGSIAYGLTNGSGNAYASYQSPVSANELGFYSTRARDCTNPSYSSYRELVINSTDPGLLGQEENLYLYQIEKDDIILGYKTVEDFLDDLFAEQSPAWVTDSTTRIKWNSEMVNKYELADFVEPTIEGEPINGRKIIVYKIDGSPNYDATALNPVTGQLGAVMPVQPVLIEEITESLGDGTEGLWRVIFPENSLPDCGTSEDIAGYWLIGTKRVSFQAHCWSPFYSSEIYSNTVIARLTLPDYMLGVYTNELGVKIPFGWKIQTDTDNVASAINGVTFVTINPADGPYQILDLVSDPSAIIETGTYADAPFRTIGFKLKIEI